MSLDRVSRFVAITVAFIGAGALSYFVTAESTPQTATQATPPTALNASTDASDSAITAALRSSVVNFSCKLEPRSAMRPWKLDPVQEVGGSGVVIAPGRILTNAHVVHQSTEILLESEQTSLAIPATLIAIDVGRDLALVETTDAEFIANHPPVALFAGLPRDGARVTVMGFPMGGEALSTTSGVISRSEWADIGEGGENGMRVQVDAAVNFGNSGGPAFVDGKLAGLVFSGLDNAVADNISYLISTEEIGRFLGEVDAGTIDGNCVIAVQTQTLENPALRAKLGVNSSVAGVVVISAQNELLKPWDIITSINGYLVDNKGQISIEESRKVAMECAAGRFDPAKDGPSIKVEVLREGKSVEVMIPAQGEREGIVRTRVNGAYPYLVFGPMVFGPVHTDLLGAMADEGSIAIYYYGNSPVLPAMSDESPAKGKEFVAVLCPLLSHPIARGYDGVPGQTVKSVNGKTFANFAEFVAILRALDEEWVVFEFNERGIERIVFRASEIEAATERVMDANGIRQQASKDVRAIWAGSVKSDSTAHDADNSAHTATKPAK